MGLFLNFLMVFLLPVIVTACSTKNDYHYNVVDCKQPQIQALGDYILDKLRKQQREIMQSTCYDAPLKYLKSAPFISAKKEFDSRRLAGTWLFQRLNAPKTVFAGPEETIAALESGSTYNILIDKNFSTRRYVLRNSTDGSISVAYLNEEDLMSKVSNIEPWKMIDVLECESFIFHLSKTFGNQLTTFSLMDKAGSNQEFRFLASSGGCGGFYKVNE